MRGTLYLLIHSLRIMVYSAGSGGGVPTQQQGTRTRHGSGSVNQPQNTLYHPVKKGHCGPIQSPLHCQFKLLLWQSASASNINESIMIVMMTMVLSGIIIPRCTYLHGAARSCYLRLNCCSNEMPLLKLKQCDL